jgi:NADH-quinone oxidoreductase subunit G
VRFTTNITKSHELGVFGRGDAAVIDVYPGKTLTNAYAMNVVDLCPVGALTSKAFRFKKRVWFLRSFEAICPGCARGCNVFVDHHREKYEDDWIYRIRPRVNEAVNGHFMCDAGRMVYEEQNLKRPVKAYSRGIALSVKEVIEEARREIMHPLSVVVISASASLEELWMARFFESALGLKVYVSCHSDPEFEDDYLRVADREMNVAGAKALGLECICDPKIIFEEARFVVLIGQKEVERWIEACEAHGMPFGLIHAHATSPKARWSLPIASHFERSGRFMAQGGLVQESKAGLDKQAPRLSLVALLTQLFDYSPAFIEETMRALAAHLEGSHG